MAPSWQVKEGKYYLDEVQAKLSQHVSLSEVKGLQKKPHPATACEVCHLLRKAKHSTTRKYEVKKKFNCAEVISYYRHICSHRLFIKASQYLYTASKGPNKQQKYFSFSS